MLGIEPETLCKALKLIFPCRCGCKKKNTNPPNYVTRRTTELESPTVSNCPFSNDASSPHLLSLNSTCQEWWQLQTAGLDSHETAPGGFFCRGSLQLQHKEGGGMACSTRLIPRGVCSRQHCVTWGTHWCRMCRWPTSVPLRSLKASGAASWRSIGSIHDGY